jgi:hypothetical protein
LTACKLCKRESAPKSTLCKYHLSAKRNLESAYEEWSKAYGGITWKDYLQRVGRNAETGQWAKEVAELISEDSEG